MTTTTPALGRSRSFTGLLARSRSLARSTTWEQRAYAGLLLATALLYLVGLSESGYANSFYAAAAQAGSESWSAFFFGASDAAGSITVDKTPLSLWPAALAVQVFGLSSWAILVPQALMGVASVALLHGTVRRSTGSHVAGLIAGATLALTPVAVLMFRFNNPDAMLTLFLIGAAAATLRALEATTETNTRWAGRPARWLALGGALVGLAFLAKMLQAFLVLPALALPYLIFAAVPIGRRLGHLLVAFGSMVLAGGWYVVIVELWPGDRPYIGGSQNDSILELTLGYNGLGRLTGDEVGSVGGGNGWGETGILRLFGTDNAGNIAWLIPAALLLGGVALALTRRDRSVPAALTLWSTWLITTALVFSFMSGIYHAYYTVALAPAVAALVGIGGHTLWVRRTSLVASGTLALAMAATSVTAFVLLSRTEGWLPWLRYAVLVVGLLGAVLLAGVSRLPARVATIVAAVAVVTALSAPAAYSLQTAATPHTGSIPTSGPELSGGLGGPGAGLRGGGPGPGTGSGPGGAGGPGAGAPAQGTTDQGTTDGTTRGAGRPGGNTAGSAGGLINGSTSSAEMTALLLTDADDYTWVLAAVGSQSASGYQLATERSVMPIGGFNGSDPSPTLTEFQQLVADGEIHFFIAGGGQGGGRGGQGDTSGSSAEISTWVAETFASTTVDGVSVYDLS